jgi:hypothetical protein
MMLVSLINHRQISCHRLHYVGSSGTIDAEHDSTLKKAIEAIASLEVKL